VQRYETMNAARRVLLASYGRTRMRRTCLELGICASKCVELGGIEPPSISQCTDPIRPFPTCGSRCHAGGSAACRHPKITAGPGSSFRTVSVLPRLQRSFPPSSPASGAGLRWIGPVRHCCSRCLSDHRFQCDWIRRRERTAGWQFFVVAPFSESEQLGSQTRTTDLMSKPVSPVIGMCIHSTTRAGNAFHRLNGPF
jgi:hypothetical protein